MAIEALSHRINDSQAKLDGISYTDKNKQMLL